MPHPRSSLPLEMSLLAAVESPMMKMVVVFSGKAEANSNNANVTKRYLNRFIFFYSVVLIYSLFHYDLATIGNDKTLIAVVNLLASQIVVRAGFAGVGLEGMNGRW